MTTIREAFADYLRSMESILPDRLDDALCQVVHDACQDLGSDVLDGTVTLSDWWLVGYPNGEDGLEAWVHRWAKAIP